MVFKELEIQGFKSFPDKVKIRFDAGVTGVVGPNGSGKSNLSDAVRWVLGETSSRQLRAAGKTTPVLLLTARDAIADRVAGLDSGANDYLVKPFALEELSARLRVLTGSQFGAGDSRLVAGDLTLDTGTRRVKRGGAEIALSAREYALLEYLMHNKGIVLSREKIENHVWNFDYEGGTNVVDVYIRYLRKKIDDGHESSTLGCVPTASGWAMCCGRRRHEEKLAPMETHAVVFRRARAHGRADIHRGVLREPFRPAKAAAHRADTHRRGQCGRGRVLPKHRADESGR